MPVWGTSLRKGRDYSSRRCRDQSSRLSFTEKTMRQNILSGLRRHPRAAPRTWGLPATGRGVELGFEWSERDAPTEKEHIRKYIISSPGLARKALSSDFSAITTVIQEWECGAWSLGGRHGTGSRWRLCKPRLAGACGTESKPERKHAAKKKIWLMVSTSCQAYDSASTEKHHRRLMSMRENNVQSPQNKPTPQI